MICNREKGFMGFEYASAFPSKTLDFCPYLTNKNMFSNGLFAILLHIYHVTVQLADIGIISDLYNVHTAHS